jgi:hypothetical protein
VRALLDAEYAGGCPPAGTCRGFDGNCADLAAQFAFVPVLPDYEEGLDGYECHAFPDSAKRLDSFIVGLISIAVSLPVVIFLTSSFAMANDSDVRYIHAQCRRLHAMSARVAWHALIGT